MEADNSLRAAIIIRPARIDDADAVFGMVTELATSYRPRRDVFDVNFPALIHSTGADLLVACESNTVRGYALALRIPTLYANGDLWNLQELFVDAAHRSRGIGRLLLDCVVENARSRSAVEVTVVSRRAGPYYVKNGFTETAAYYKLKLTG